MYVRFRILLLALLFSFFVGCKDKDIDGDGLTNKEEIEIWGSDPNNIDSDGDGLLDGAEINIHYTSPIISDTDGDGLNDFQEVNEYSLRYSPFIANTPIIEIDLTGGTSILPNVVTSGGKSVSDQVSQDIEYGQSTSSESQDTSTHEVSAEISASVSVEAEASLLPSATVTAEVSATAGYAYTNTSSVSESSASESREKYGKLSNKMANENWELKDGMIRSQINVKNAGDLAFTLEDITVTAILRDISNPSNFKSVAQLRVDEGVEAITLGPNEWKKGISVVADITGGLALDLLADPEQLLLEVNHFELSKLEAADNAQTKFSYLQQETNAKTAYIHIDYGRRDVIRKRVATNIRKTNGENKGEKLTQILRRMLNVDFETKIVDRAHGDSIQILNGLWNPMRNEMTYRNDSISGFWTVVGSEDIRITKETNFEDIMVPGGSAIYLLYVIDEDKDGLFASEEFVQGTYDNQYLAQQNGIKDARDYDGDGLTDGEEVKLGWEIPISNLVNYKPYDENGTWVYSNPKSADEDDDGLNDAMEREKGTDPNRKDTDNDSYVDKFGVFRDLNDSLDQFPIDPANRDNTPPVVTLKQRQEGNKVYLDYKATHPALKRIWMIWDNNNNVPSGVLRPQKFEGTISYKYPKKGTYHGRFVVHDKYGGITREQFTFVID